MFIKKYNNLFQIKKYWIELTSSNNKILPFQEYDIIKRTFINYYPYLISHRQIPVFYVFFEDNKAVLIAPFVKDLSGRLELFGNVNGNNYCDFVYKDDNIIKKCMKLLMSTVEFNNMNLYKIREGSNTFVGIEQFCKILQKTTNVKIDMGIDYVLYYNKLSHSVKQNLRTSYNRLKRDNHVYKLCVYYGSGLIVDAENKSVKSGKFEISNLFDELIYLYNKRHVEHYGIKSSWMRNWFIRHLNFATLNFIHSPIAMTLILYVDDEIAAFMSGYKSQANEFIVPRLSMLDKYKFYSPGMLLLNESIKFLIEHSSIRVLDLSQGNEQYKLRMGGCYHYTYNCEISKDGGNI
jgi:hypothetical protein